MAKIDKDPFENYLKQNAPDDAPSLKLLKNLQGQAVWNKPVPVSKNRKLILATIAMVGLLLIGMYVFQSSNTYNKVQPVEIQAPVFEEEMPEIQNVFACNDDLLEMGMYRLMKHKSEDFNLSFFYDASQITMLEVSRELDNI